jgi:thiamine biosynthesis lipoprotein
MNRRDFLHPRQFARSAGQVLAALDEISQLTTLSDPEDEIALLRLSRRAMATTFEFIVPFGTPDALGLGEAVLDRIDDLETQLTVYRDTSEVSRLNRLAPYQAVPVEAGLFGLLELAAQLTRETEGAFDITAGALIKAWGFYRGPRRVPTDEEMATARQRVGMNHVTLDPADQSVRYQRPGLEINLGSIGKGYALDRVAEMVDQEWGLPTYLVHGGRSSVFARGTPGHPRGWEVTLRHPWDPERRLAVLWLRDRGMGTSAATYQYLEHQGKKLGHVLDPRTGWPASGMASISVLAPTAAQADALSTAFFILGSEAARRYCESHPEISAILLPDGEGAEPVVLGLAPTNFTLLPDRDAHSAAI